MAVTPRVKNLINDIAGLIRDKYGIQGPINDIDNIVKRMGGRVVEDYLLDGFSDGKIRKLNEETGEWEDWIDCPQWLNFDQR